MGFQVNTRPDPTPAPGVYHVEVIKAEEKRGRDTGDGYFSVTFAALDFGKKTLCIDNIMVEGKGRGMGVGKLKALGIDLKDPTVFVDTSMIRGRRCYVNVGEEEYKGTTSLKVKRLDKGDLGYFHEDTPPENVRKMTAGEEHGDSGDPLMADTPDDTPF